MEFYILVSILFLKVQHDFGRPGIGPSGTSDPYAADTLGIIELYRSISNGILDFLALGVRFGKIE